jgi:hypothetical protein
MNDLAAGCLSLGGGLHHIHDNKGRDLAAPRRPENGFPWQGTQPRFVHLALRLEP